MRLFLPTAVGKTLLAVHTFFARHLRRMFIFSNVRFDNNHFLPLKSPWSVILFIPTLGKLYFVAGSLSLIPTRKWGTFSAGMDAAAARSWGMFEKRQAILPLTTSFFQGARKPTTLLGSVPNSPLTKFNDRHDGSAKNHRLVSLPCPATLP